MTGEVFGIILDGIIDQCICDVNKNEEKVIQIQYLQSLTYSNGEIDYKCM